MGVGRFLTFEGIDGSGKSTQARRLAEGLRAAGHDVVVTREPGGAPGAEAIRKLLVSGAPERWSAETEILLFTAARRDHLERTIAPALAAGRIVVSDRFADSTRVYQAARDSGLRAIVDRLHDLMIGREPDATFLIDTDPTTAHARATAATTDEQRFEARGPDFQNRLRDDFLALAAEAPERFHVIDGRADPATVAGRIRPLAEALL